MSDELKAILLEQIKILAVLNKQNIADYEQIRKNAETIARLSQVLSF